MDKLKVSLLGKPEVTLAGKSLIEEFTTTKTQALLYFLVVTGRAHSREVLAGLLWGDMPEAKAKRNLTKALSNLRQLLEPYLIIDRQSIEFNPNAGYWLDVAVFQHAVESDPNQQTLSTLREAVTLYRGDFLEGFYVKDSLEFEDWALALREQLRERLIDALDAIVEAYIAQGDSGDTAGVDYANRLLNLDPWRESAHRQMMTLLARRGQRSAALAQYETCRRVLTEEFGVEPSTETIALYERLRDADNPVPNNLPPQPNPFVGRETELKQVTGYLSKPNCRLLSIIGPGGIGKTRLALEAAAQFTGSDGPFQPKRFVNGIYFIDVAAATPGGTIQETGSTARTANVLASAIAEALNISFHGSVDLMRQLLNYLRDKEVLLILDNFEYLVVEGAVILSEMLRNAPHMTLLVTSRERLNLIEEWVIEVAGLEFPESEGVAQGGFPDAVPVNWPAANASNRPLSPASLAELEKYSAVALFVQQAKQLQVGFTLSAVEAPHVVQICRLLEGAPLALELAAGWLRVLTCADIVKEIEKSLDFLTTSLRNVPERHRSLRAVFEQSWGMLSKQEQMVFRKLSVCRGGFQKEAARAVADASLPILAGLVDKSLLRLSASGRYEVHELLRQYAAERLAEVSAEREAALAAHCRYYAAFLSEQEASLMGPEGLAKLRELGQEVANCRASWHHTISPGREIAVTEINQSIWSLRYLYSRRGWFQEAVDMFEQAAARLEDAAASAVPTPEQRAVYGRVLLSLGIVRQYLGDLNQAIALFRRGFSTINESGVTSFGAQRAQGMALHLLGIAAWQQGDFNEAERLLTEGLLLFKSIDDHIYEARSLSCFGIVEYERGNYPEAKNLLEEAVRAFRSIGEFWYVTEALGRLAQANCVLGEPLDEIKQLLQKQVDDVREAGNIWAIAHTLQYLGTTLRLIGGDELVVARDVLQESVALYRELNMAWGIVPTLYQLGLTMMALEDYEAAEAQFREALAFSTRSQLTPTILEVSVGLASLLIEQQSPSMEQKERLLTLLTLVLNHPASNRYAQDSAASLLAKLDERNLPSPVVAAAKQRGQTISLTEMMEELLPSLTPHHRRIG